MNVPGNHFLRAWRFLLYGSATILLLASLLSCSTPARSTDPDGSQQDNRITFFPSYGYQRDNQWHIPFRVWVSDNPSWVREYTGKGGRKILSNIANIEELTDKQVELYRWRVRDFISDSKSDRRVFILFDNDPEHQRIALESDEGELETDFNGLLEGSITLSEKRAQQLLKLQGNEDNWLTFLVTSGKYEGRGRIQLIPSTGLTIISDIDDTTKITDISKGESIVIDNVFFSDYRAAPCMALMYQNFGDDAVFHYVSGGPWQLYRPTTDFIFSESTGFPPGSVHMKNVRTNFLEKESYMDFWKLAGFSGSATVAQKTAAIEQLLSHFPQRRFVLIGDSGEHDPEIFNNMRLRHPDQIDSIRIRDVINASEEQPERLAGMSVIAPDAQTCH